MTEISLLRAMLRMAYMIEFLNMLVGGHVTAQVAYYHLVGDHVTGKRHIDPAQWRGWPRLVFVPVEGYHYEGVW